MIDLTRLVPRSPRSWLVIVGAVLIIAVVAVSAHRALSAPTVNVKTAVVEMRIFEDDALVTATVESLQQEQIVAPFNARLVRYDVAEGDRFSAGQVLAEMDIGDVEKQAREAESTLAVAEAQRDQAYHPYAPGDLAQARANLVSAQAAADAADKKLARTQQLVAQSFDDQADLDTDTSNDAQAQAALKTAIDSLSALTNPDPRKLAINDAQVSQAQITAEDDENTVAEGKLTASFAGVVLQKIPDEGAYLQQGAPVLVVADPGRIQVEADLSEQDIGGIALGQNATVQWAGQPDKTWQATVVRLAPAVTKSSNQNENVVVVYLQFSQNPDGLLPGASVDVTIHRITPHQALVAPNEALLGSGATCTLFVVTGGRVHRRTVRAGYSNELYTEILSGVSKGEHVVLDPSKLQDGQSVKDTGDGEQP
jgi:HlyD family secretion protein